MTPRPRAGAKQGQAASWFPQNLRTLRGEKSQTEFAEWLLVSQQTLSFWEKGQRRPSRRAWAVLEQRLGVTQARLESAPLPASVATGVAEAQHHGPTIALPPHHGAAALRLELKGLTAEAVGVADIQRMLREALRKKRPVWLVLG